MNIASFKGNAEFAGLLGDICPQLFRRLPVCHSELYFLADKIIELKSGEIRRDILCCGEEKSNQYQQNKDLSAAQTEHDRKLYTVSAVDSVGGPFPSLARRGKRSDRTVR